MKHDTYFIANFLLLDDFVDFVVGQMQFTRAFFLAQVRM
jgi:hypothetical protein